MALLYINSLVSLAAFTIWLLWSHTYLRRGNGPLAALYAAGAVATFIMGLGFAVVIRGGDPSLSAIGAREWLPFALGLPAIARLIELLRDMRSRTIVDDILFRAETRANDHDAAHDPDGSEQ